MSNTLQGQAPGDHGDGLHEQRTAAHQFTLMIRVAAMVTLFTGMTVLAGWLGDFPLLKSVLPGAVEMKANTALGLIAAGSGTAGRPKCRSET